MSSVDLVSSDSHGCSSDMVICGGTLCASDYRLERVAGYIL